MKCDARVGLIRNSTVISSIVTYIYVTGYRYNGSLNSDIRRFLTVSLKHLCHSLIEHKCITDIVRFIMNMARCKEI
jgi:hypothetical protein